MFRWVGEAFGPRLAFLAMAMLWIEVTVWFPDRADIRGRYHLAFIDPHQTFDEALAANKFFVLGIVLFIYWLATFIAFKGVGAFARIKMGRDYRDDCSGDHSDCTWFFLPVQRSDAAD